MYQDFRIPFTFDLKNPFSCAEKTKEAIKLLDHQIQQHFKLKTFHMVWQNQLITIQNPEIIRVEFFTGKGTEQDIVGYSSCEMFVGATVYFQGEES